MFTVTIVPNQNGHPERKLADAELHFDEGPLKGLKLVGFGVWQGDDGMRVNVSFPARHYTVNGERRSFVLLRPIDDPAAKEELRQLIIEAYTSFYSPQRGDCAEVRA